MNNMSQVFADIAQLKQDKSNIEEELKKKESLAMAYIREQEVEKVETDYGNFIPVYRNMYIYSNEVVQKSEELSELKKTEEQNGKAQIKGVSTSLRFTRSKK